MTEVEQTLQQKVAFLLGPRSIVMRPVEESDIPYLYKWINDPKVRQYLNAYMPMTMTDEQSWYESLTSRKPKDIILMIEVDGTPIGNMGIHGINMQNGTATTGAIIGEKEYWGKGYGSDAKMILLDYAFNTLNLRKIYSTVIAFNERSLKYSLKCGYKEEGRRKLHHYKKGQYWDDIQLAVFKEDWLPLWEKFVKKHNLDQN